MGIQLVVDPGHIDQPRIRGRRRKRTAVPASVRSTRKTSCMVTWYPEADPEGKQDIEMVWVACFFFMLVKATFFGLNTLNPSLLLRTLSGCILSLWLYLWEAHHGCSCQQDKQGRNRGMVEEKNELSWWKTCSTRIASKDLENQEKPYVDARFMGFQ